jgi:hypothetical protein
MMTRCYNPRFIGAKYYSERGISVADRWHTFENFLADMGERPKGTSLDRYPNQDGNYEPGNCRWATARQQAQNTSFNRLIEWRGEIRCITEWARLLGVTTRVIFGRINSGWPIDEVMSKGRRERVSSYVHPASLKTECKRGHALVGANLRINPRGLRSCVVCNLAMSRARYLRKTRPSIRPDELEAEVSKYCDEKYGARAA